MPSKDIQRCIDGYTQHLKEKESSEEPGTEKIHVDEIASKVAAFYEKVRNVIEYRDAHLLRKGAIERTLRRRVLLKTFNEDFAEKLIKELIRGGHLSNDAVPETKIADLQQIIDNLLFLLESKNVSEDGQNGVSEWLVSMFASRIEEELFPFPEGTLLADMMYGTMKENLVLKNISMTQKEADLQLFVAVRRALFKPDKNQLQYTLLKITYPHLGTMADAELTAMSSNLATAKTTIERILKNPFAPYFSRLCEKEKTVFQLIGDLIFEGVPLDEDYESSLKFNYERRYRKAKQQLRRLAFLSVISFLISKVLIAFAIEIPLDQYFYHTISITSMAVNVLFPPLLMLVIFFFTKLPSKQNFALVESAVKETIDSDERKYVVSAPKKPSAALNAVLYCAYGIVLIAILYFLTKILLSLHFSPASIVIFLLFTSMVVATGVKVRNRAREMSMERERASVLSFLIDLIIVPFMAIGRWTIAGLSQFNVIVIAFDFLIELPVQFFVEFLENFRSFITARKDEVK